MRQFLIAVLVVVFGLPTDGWCSEDRSLAVLPIEGRRIDEDTTAILSELLVGHLSELKIRRVITMREVESMLGFDNTRAMLNCSAGQCVAKIGGALGVDEVLQSTIGRLGGQLIIGLSLIDITRAEVIARASVKVNDDESDYDAGLGQAVDQIFESEIGSRPKRSHAQTSNLKTKSSALTPVQLESTSSGSFALPSAWSWALLGSGAGLLATGGYFGSQAVAKSSEAYEFTPGSQVAVSQGKAHMLKANIFLGVGGALVGGGLLLWLLEGDFAGEKTLSFAPVVHQQGVGVVVQGEIW